MLSDMHHYPPPRDKEGFPGGKEPACSAGSDGKEPACSEGDPGFDLWVRKYPGEGEGYPFQYSCLENSMDRGARKATVHEISESDTTE